MLNRRHIRVKVMQTIYAFRGSESDDLSKHNEFLLSSLTNMYKLYLVLLSLIIEIQKRAESHLTKSQSKHLATQDDVNPNTKFINNQLLKVLVDNKMLSDKLKEHKINNWELDNEYVELLFKDITASTIYKDYMSLKTTSFKEDAIFVSVIFKEIIAPNEKLYDYLEDKNLTWLDDLPTVNTAILRLLKKAKSKSVDDYFTPKLFKDSDDKDFAFALFKKTIENSEVINQEIENKTKNWDAERIASVDYALLQMAICELQHFSSIPVKVTINECLEIAKEYSTPKSSIFINGILDKLVKEYEQKNTLNKEGRGLM